MTVSDSPQAAVVGNIDGRGEPLRVVGERHQVASVGRAR